MPKTNYRNLINSTYNNARKTDISELSRQISQLNIDDQGKVSSKSSTKPIPIPNKELSQEEQNELKEIGEQERLYDNLTWKMYNRIINDRKKQQINNSDRGQNNDYVYYDPKGHHSSDGKANSFKDESQYMPFEMDDIESDQQSYVEQYEERQNAVLPIVRL